MKQWIIVMGGFALWVLLFIGASWLLSQEPDEKILSSEKKLDREILRKARVFFPEQSNQPLVEIGSFRLVKPRWGGFSLAGINVIEIDTLSIILPSDLWIASETNSGGTVDSSGSVHFRGRSFFRDSLSLNKLKRLAGVTKKVSAAKINDLGISILSNEGKRIEILCAKSAKSVSSARFSLKECGFLDESLAWNEASSVELEVNGSVCLIDRDTKVDMLRVIQNICSRTKE